MSRWKKYQPPTPPPVIPGQMSIFDAEVQLGSKSPNTSAAAAEKVLPKTGSQRARVLRAIVDAGDDGIHDDVISMVTLLQSNDVRPRRGELVRDGWVVNSGRTKKNLRGNDCILWVATDEARRALAKQETCCQ